MSRLPFGLCFCAPLLVTGCASLFTTTTQFPAVVQQQPAQLRGNHETPSSQVQRADRKVPLPGETPAPSTSTEEVLPADIDLGQPQRFPETSQPLTVEKPDQHRVVSQSSSSDISRIPFESSTHRPVLTSHAGLGSYRVLILGSIYGNDPESIELLKAAVQEVTNFSQSPSYSFLLIQTPNPDGLEEHIRTNHNGVDLNRNFPSTWFTAVPTRLTGPHPASEVETKNLMRILKEFQPHRVLHVRSSIGQRPLVLLNDQLNHAASKIQLPQKVDVGTFAGQYKAGSLEEFVTLRVDAEMMTILLPPKGFQQLSAQDLFRLATTNFTKEEPATTEAPVATTPKSAPTKTTPAQPVRSILTPDGEKGYVEFLPPPPSSERFNRASKTTIPADPKYYELPPPPQ